ncbi:hypothetical protein [Nocardia asteroides]|uniref:hypothetical protein n=1 Tax=Nocardia asteroides TaxID=1824 RepID=UPI0033E11E32
MSEPIPVPFTVTRYRCPCCTRRTASRKSAIAEHIARCWHNPDVRTCRTCSAGESSPGRGHGYEDGYLAYQHCRRAITLPADGTPVVGCPLWTPKDTDRG